AAPSARPRPEADEPNALGALRIGLHQYPARGGCEIVHHGVCRETRARTPFLDRAGARAHEDRARAHGASELDVAPLVPDDERLRRFEMERVGCAIDERASRLAAVARPPVLGHRALRVVRTIVIRV